MKLKPTPENTLITKITQLITEDKLPKNRQWRTIKQISEEINNYRNPPLTCGTCGHQWNYMGTPADKDDPTKGYTGRKTRTPCPSCGQNTSTTPQPRTAYRYHKEHNKPIPQPITMNIELLQKLLPQHRNQIHELTRTLPCPCTICIYNTLQRLHPGTTIQNPEQYTWT